MAMAGAAMAANSLLIGIRFMENDCITEQRPHETY